MLYYRHEKIISFPFYGILSTFHLDKRLLFRVFTIRCLLCLDTFYQTSLTRLEEQYAASAAQGKRKSPGGKTARACLLHCRAQEKPRKATIFRA